VLLLREFVADQVHLTESLVRQLHGIVLRGIDRENAGRYRSMPVMISGSRHLPPQPWQVAKLMETCCADYQQQRTQLHPVVLAAHLHERIATIHPFIDGNGRTARLVMNLILLQHGYPIANIPGDTESRLAYYDALERCNLDNDPVPFQQLVAGHVLGSIKNMLKVLGDAP
jgi:Fic family protein